jgi:hypothetical protein
MEKNSQLQAPPYLVPGKEPHWLGSRANLDTVQKTPDFSVIEPVLGKSLKFKVSKLAEATMLLAYILKVPVRISFGKPNVLVKVLCDCPQFSQAKDEEIS